MLEPTRPVSKGATIEPRSSTTGPRSSQTQSRTSRRKRGIFRRNGIVLPAFGLAVLLVAVVAITAKVMSPNGSGANSLATAIDSLPQSGSVALLEQERQTIIVMDAASKTLSVASKPVMVNPKQVMASASEAANASSSSTVTQVSAPPPNPGTAQSIGYNMLPAFGFSQKTQWTCLLDLWNRESGWMYDAENPSSGAYGIPQALPGYKMAAAGADWQTNPATQIKWGLGYIQSIYGTPCGAWNFELANGYY